VPLIAVKKDKNNHKIKQWNLQLFAMKILTNIFEALTTSQIPYKNVCAEKGIAI
jgi:hypothetical protein